jgi:hypothetical protein
MLLANPCELDQKRTAEGAIVPDRAPVTVGLNITPTVQSSPAPMPAPQVLPSTTKSPLATTVETDNAVFRLFVKVTVLATLVVPTAKAANAKLAGDAVTGGEPVPISLTDCGLPTASSVNVRLPTALPVAAGENVTSTLQLARAAISAPQVLLATTKPALVRMLEKLSRMFSWLINVTVLAVLVSPTATVPKSKAVAGNRVTGTTPVPVRVNVCGLFAAPSVNVRLPVVAPVAAGANVTSTLQAASAATPAPQALLAMTKPALGWMLVKLSCLFSWLVSRTVLAFVSPTATLPKSKVVAGKRVTGATPVPVRSNSVTKASLHPPLHAPPEFG